MNFNKSRVAKLAGLLRESREDVHEADHDEMAEEAEEVEEVEETYEVDEAGLEELEESFDLRRVIRDEISKAIRNRDERTYEWTTGQVHGRKTRAQPGAVTMGFPGIGFRR
jgi:hypothetical protein